MWFSAITSTQTDAPQSPLPDLVNPSASMLARLLESRLANEQSSPCSAPLPTGVSADFRPSLPPISTAAVMLYARRQHVESFPLIYSTLALAHPN